MDSREEKFNKIIDDGKASVTKALKEIHDEFASRADLMVKPSVIDYRVSDGVVRPVIQGAEHALTDHAKGQVFERAGIPQAFAQKLIGLGENLLLETNLIRMTGRLEEDGVLVRRINRQNSMPLIKGWLSPSYKRMDASPVFEAFLDRSIKKGFVPFRGLNTDYRYQISMVYPQIFHPRENEYMVFGISLMTGDYGNQSMEINLLMMRIVCMNLSIGYDLFRKVHLGSRFQMGDDDVISISEQTHRLDTATIASAIGDVVDSGEEHVKMLEQKIRQSADEILSDSKRGNILDGLKKRFGKEIAEKVKSTYDLPEGVEVLPAGQSLWRMSNAMSLVASGIERVDDRVDLERESMKIIVN